MKISKIVFALVFLSILTILQAHASPMERETV